MKYLLVLLLIIFSRPSSSCTSVYEVAIFTGIAFYDGYGDLGSSQRVINEIVPKIKDKYGKCFKINIVFLEEPAENFRQRREKLLISQALKGIQNSAGSKEVVEPDQWRMIADFFNEGIFDGIKEKLFIEGDKIRPVDKFIEVNDVRFMSEEYYLSKHPKVDLQIQVSALLGFDNNPHYTLSRDFYEKAKMTLRFQEADVIAEKSESLLVSKRWTEGEYGHSYRVQTGVRGAGFYFKQENSRPIEKKDLFDLIQNSKNYDQLNSLDDFTNNNSILFHSYLSNFDSSISSGLNSKRRIMELLKVAFEFYKKENKKIILVQNTFRKANLEGLFRQVDEYSLKEAKFKDFFYKKVKLVFQNKVPTDEFRSLQYWAEIPAVTGEISFADALNLKKIPFYEARNHKKRHVEELYEVYRETFLKLEEERKLVFSYSDKKDFLNLLDYGFLTNASKKSISSGRYKHIDIYKALKNPNVLEAFNRIQEHLSTHYSLYDFIEESIGLFYENNSVLDEQMMNFFSLERQPIQLRKTTTRAGTSKDFYSPKNQINKCMKLFE